MPRGFRKKYISGWILESQTLQKPYELFLILKPQINFSNLFEIRENTFSEPHNAISAYELTKHIKQRGSYSPNHRFEIKTRRKYQKRIFKKAQ